MCVDFDKRVIKTSSFHFDLPEELIAQTPLLDRATSRLLTLDKQSGKINHMHFYDLPQLLQNGDCLVLNNTKVMPARLIGERETTGGKAELLLLTRKDKDVWETLANPGKKIRPGNKIIFGSLLKAVIEDVTTGGNRIVRFIYDGIFEEILDKLGEMPLPPYITEKLQDKNRYQTVYAKHEGSAAAPTAGLHFTEETLDKLKEKGVKIAYITLHVGLGTFRPVKVDDIAKHEMHSEFYTIEQEQADIINKTKEKRGRIVSVGTTSTRTLEAASDKNGIVQSGSGWTDIFIYPPYRFKVIDALITNFHLPESTLIMLVSALAGRENVLAAYDKAVSEKYRFFSFGDAMYIY